MLCNIKPVPITNLITTFLPKFQGGPDPPSGSALVVDTIDSVIKGNLSFLVGKKSINCIKHFYFKLKLTRSNFFFKPKKREGFISTKYYVTICPIIFYENNTVK